MKYLRMHPPGTWCQNAVVKQAIAKHPGRTFVEVGCGTGVLLELMTDLGMTGLGLDLSETAIRIANENLKTLIQSNKLKIMNHNFMDLDVPAEKYDWGISCMVIEHLKDDSEFLNQLKNGLSQMATY